jgi:hypothetical protein
MEPLRVHKAATGSSALFFMGLLVAPPASAQFRGSGGDVDRGSSYPSARAAAADPSAPVSTSPEIRFGALGIPVGLPPGEPAVDTRRFIFQPSIGVDLLATDNVFQTSRNRKSDLITSINPTILMNIDTARLTAW